MIVIGLRLVEVRTAAFRCGNFLLDRCDILNLGGCGMKTSGARPRRRIREEKLVSPNLSWDELRIEVGAEISHWRDEWYFTQEEMHYWLSRDSDLPYRERDPGVSTRWVGGLLLGQLRRAPLPWEILAIACITGHLFDPVLIRWGKKLGYRLEVPPGDGLREQYDELCARFRNPQARVKRLGTLFRDLRTVMTQ